MSGLLDILLVVPVRTPDALSAQAVRLIVGICADPRYRLRILTVSPEPAVPRAPGIRCLLTLEERLVPALVDRNPLPTLPPLSFCTHLPPGDAAPDIVIDLAGAVEGARGVPARHGVWRIVDAPENGALAASLTAAPTSRALLVRDPGAGVPPRLISQALYDTKPLATYNLAYVAEKSAQMVLRELARTARDGAPADLGPAPDAGPLPGVGPYLRHTVRESLHRVGEGIARRWGGMPGAFHLRLGRGSLSDFDPASAREYPMPGVRFAADPFLIRHAGALWCFFEELDHPGGRGYISAARVTDDGLKDVQVVLRQRHHMSFPFVFEHAGQVFMIPEIHDARRLEVWRATRFPTEWELHATAFEGESIADSVLFERDRAWWLFTHISRDRFGDHCSDLHVFSVDGPGLSRIEPHALNPVVTDASTARGGGRVHLDGGRTFRVSQDNSGGGYGYGFNVMEITRLDRDHYEEHRVRRVTPGFAPGIGGCHHLDVADGWFVIDARRD